MSGNESNILISAASGSEDTRIPDGMTPVVGFRRFAIPWPPASKENDRLVQERAYTWLQRVAIDYIVPIVPLNDLKAHTLEYGEEYVEVG